MKIIVDVTAKELEDMALTKDQLLKLIINRLDNTSYKLKKVFHQVELHVIPKK